MTAPFIHRPLAWQFRRMELTGFGLAVLAAFAIAQIILERELVRRGHGEGAVADIVFAAVAATLVGATLYDVLVLTHRWSDLFTRGGFFYCGGFLGAVAASALVIRRPRPSFLQIADVATIAIAAGYAVGRTGWAIGDDYGRSWDGPLAVAFPHGAPPSAVANMRDVFHAAVPAGLAPDAVLGVYPTQLLEVVLGLGMFAILWRLRRHRHAAGWLFGVHAVLAGVERFIVEFFRAKDARFFIGGLGSAQAIAVAVTIVGVACMIWRRHVGPGRAGIYARDDRATDVAAA